MATKSILEAMNLILEGQNVILGRWNRQAPAYLQRDLHGSPAPRRRPEDALLRQRNPGGREYPRPVSAQTVKSRRANASFDTRLHLV